jgi:hypothetical protein
VRSAVRALAPVATGRPTSAASATAAATISALDREYPTIAALRTQLGPDGDSVPLLGAMAMLYGWTVFGDQLLDAFEASVDERPELERRLARLAASMPQNPLP